MTFARVASALAAMLRWFSFAFLVPAGVALAYEPWDLVVAGLRLPENTYTFLVSFLSVNAIALPIGLATRAAEEEDLSDREGYLTVAVAWLVVPVFAMLPFLFSSSIPSTFDAYVEAASALTTTGFSTLADPADLDPSLLFWRALVQWLGGIGIVALGMALLAKLTHGGLRLAPLDASVQASKRLRPKMADTARALLVFYASATLGLMAVLFAILLGEGMPARDAIFDAAVHLLAAFSTGGLARTASVAGFGWPALAVLGLAMLVGATSFQVLLGLRAGNVRAALRDPEWRFFLAILAVAAVAITVGLALSGHGWADAVRDGAWSAGSAQTSTGLRTGEPAGWPVGVLLLLLVLLLVGGCSGSAAGGLKAFRILILLKIVQRQLRVLLHPRAIAPVRVGRTVIPDTAVAVAVAFTFTYVLLWLAGTLLLAAFQPGLSPLAVASGSAAALGNVGLGLDGFAPGGSIAGYTPASKLIVVALMWLGRLEVFTALLLFYPSSWRR